MQAGANEELERSNAVKKGELKALKADIEDMRQRSIDTSRANHASTSMSICSKAMTEIVKLIIDVYRINGAE